MGGGKGGTDGGGRPAPGGNGRRRPGIWILTLMMVQTTLAYPRCAHALPSDGLTSRRYRAAFARSAAELDAVQRLRFEVFNLELGEGLAASYATGRDVDEYDAGCHHLVVSRHDAPGVAIGTYRMQTSEVARGHLGFYSATEFDLSALPAAIVDNAVEVGRACVAAPHRNTQVLFLLWRGLAQYVAHNAKRYLFGCCSVSTQDEALGWGILRHLDAAGHVERSLAVTPRPGQALDPAARELPAGDIALPPLMRLYLRYGGRIVGTPAIDRQFGTIDYFMLFDVAALSEERFETLFGER